MMSIQPVILGSGKSGQAMAKSLAVLQAHWAGKLNVVPPRFLPRGELPEAREVGEHPLLLVANPHALHARTLLEAEKRGFTFMVVDKPVCTREADLDALAGLQAQVWVCHGYRQNWGPQKLRELVTGHQLGRLISIEGHYWQSSAAQKALSGEAPKDSWKNHPELSGEHDVALDLATHWMDLVVFLAGEQPGEITGWKSHVHAEAAHRDTHVQLAMKWPGGLRSLASVSKTMHGRGNDLEIHVLGEKGLATWRLESPDELWLARGSERTAILRRTSDDLGLMPFHGLGWVGGYASVIQSAVLAVAGLQSPPAPRLSESLELMRSFFRIHWTG